MTSLPSLFLTWSMIIMSLLFDLRVLLGSDRDGVWACIHNLVPLGVIIRIMFLMPETKPFSRNENNYFSKILQYKRMLPKS